MPTCFGNLQTAQVQQTNLKILIIEKMSRLLCQKTLYSTKIAKTCIIEITKKALLLSLKNLIIATKINLYNNMWPTSKDSLHEFIYNSKIVIPLKTVLLQSQICQQGII